MLYSINDLGLLGNTFKLKFMSVYFEVLKVVWLKNFSREREREREIEKEREKERERERESFVLSMYVHVVISRRKKSDKESLMCKKMNVACST